MASLLVVDDHPAVRAGLVALVDPLPELEVTGVAADAAEALEIALIASPDLVLVDVHLPGESGLALCLRLDALRPRPRIVLYSALADDVLAVLAAVAGADALVPKSADPEQLLARLVAVAAGVHAADPVPVRGLHTVGASLEEDDRKILGMLVNGTAPADIAAVLGMTDGWLVARRWAILRRLGPRPARRGDGEAWVSSPGARLQL